MRVKEIFDRYRKAIITGGGVAVFILAGMITMLLTGNETPNVKPSTQKSSVQTQNHASSPQPISQESRQASRTIYAYITGGVKNPGVYKLSDDARLFQLVDMAGGFSSRADTESLNLAEFVADGVHVHIAAKTQDSPGQSPTIPGIPASARPVQITQAQTQSGIININTATASELESLPGIGPAIAKRIIDYRNTHGTFTRPEDIINVRGIGQSTLARLLPYVTASNNSARVAQSYVTAPTSSGRVNINTATASELESLPGIGPAIAQRIIDYRNTHGTFSRPEDIINVRGIGQSKLAQILPHITASISGTRIIQPQSSAGKIDINRANSQELQRLNGVGKVTAQRIIEYRQSHGAFTSPEDLVNVRGISYAKLDKIRGQIIIR